MCEILFKGLKMAKKYDDMNTFEKTIEMTDIVKTFGRGLWGDKYNEWLDKSNTKAKGFAGKFLKVSFWLSVLLSLCGIAFIVLEIKTEEMANRMVWIGIAPLFFTTAIQLLRHKYYGLFKLLWLFPIVLWVFIFAVFGFGILSEINPELYNKIWDLI